MTPVMMNCGKNVSGCSRQPPLLKWPGGKRLLINRIYEALPPHYETYIEPFVGGGALFFALGPPKSVLSDKNRDLIEAYRQVRDRPHDVIRVLRSMENSEEHYYKVRAQGPVTPSARAARLIYLCSLAFNGIHRYNLRGEFNVPYGFKTHLTVCDEERIIQSSLRLRSAALLSWDFETTVRRAKPGDLIYFDPPYTVAHNNNGFVKYNASIFSWKDQERLAAVAQDMRRKGCHVVVSNADHDCIRNLYRGFETMVIERHSIIGGGRAYRKPITEALFWSQQR